MTKASQELEARRQRFISEAIGQRWWWFDPAHNNDKCAAALAWETLRRTTSYPALWRKAVGGRGVFLGDKRAPSLEAEKLRLMHLFQRARGGVGEICWKYLIDGFAPDKTWLELSERQRLTARGYGILGSEALKINDAWTLPRQDYSEPPLGVVTVGVCDLARDGNGRLSVSKELRGWVPLKFITGTEFFQRLKPDRYLIACFDIRHSREELLQALDADMIRWLAPPAADGSHAVTENPTTSKEADFWNPDPSLKESRPIRGDVHLLPSNDPSRAILLLPAKYNRRVFRSAFHTILKKEQRDKWLPHCVRFWKTLTETVERFPQSSGGIQRIECDASGRIIREAVKKAVFDEKVDLPPKIQRGKSGARGNLWLGLAACDAGMTAGDPLGKSSANARLLVEHCKSYSSLSNHQRTAKAYLDELDASLVRLDKNPAPWRRKSRTCLDL